MVHVLLCWFIVSRLKVDNHKTGLRFRGGGYKPLFICTLVKGAWVHHHVSFAGLIKGNILKIYSLIGNIKCFGEVFHATHPKWSNY